MTASAANILVAGTGTLWVQDAGGTITIPTDSTTAPGTGFSDMGHYSENGVKVKPSITVSHIKSTQSAGSDVRTVIKERSLSLEIELMEFKNAKALPFIFGGGTFTPGSGSLYTFVPPVAGVVDERCVIVDVVDGSSKQRLIIFRAMVTSIGDISLDRTAAATPKVSVEALYPLTGTAPWTIYGS